FGLTGMEDRDHHGHHFTNFYVTTTVQSRRNFRIIMEAFTVYFLSMEIVILTHRQITNQNNFAHDYAFEIIISAFGLGIIMQIILLLKDFPTGVIYECMNEWHKLQLFLHFGGFFSTAMGIIAMAVSETTVEEHEFTVTVAALVTSIINATWYTISKIYEKAVNLSIPAITVTDTGKEETIVLEGPFGVRSWLQTPRHRRQDGHFLVAPDISGSQPIHKEGSRFMRVPSEMLLEQALNRERYQEEMSSLGRNLSAGYQKNNENLEVL
ncbi:uncharacterized protein LOC133172462, partial [Saccostrea echinata]|uniref:uncharacterized protein LOC133172462 n=1 Tax=Saccostrea echinata TaxID=191078 RepID=UPI002A7FFD7F